MASADGKPLMRCCTCRVEKRGAEFRAEVLGWREARGGDGRYGDGGWRRWRSRADRQCPCADPRERTDRRCDNHDANQRVRHGRENFRPAHGPIRAFYLCRGQPLGRAMATTRQGGPASGVDPEAPRLRQMTVRPSAPFHRLNIDRRAEVAIDPVAGIGPLTREFKRRDRRSFTHAKLDDPIARRRRDRMPSFRMPRLRTKVQSKRHFTTRRLGSRRMRDESAPTRCRTRLGRNRADPRGAGAIALLYAS
jgi:hypothetical protein